MVIPLTKGHFYNDRILWQELVSLLEGAFYIYRAYYIICYTWNYFIYPLYKLVPVYSDTRFEPLFRVWEEFVRKILFLTQIWQWSIYDKWTPQIVICKLHNMWTAKLFSIKPSLLQKLPNNKCNADSCTYFYYCNSGRLTIRLKFQP